MSKCYFGRQESNDSCSDQMASIFAYLLVPLAGLITIWLRKELFTRILINIDALYIPVVCPSFGRGRNILNWARKRLPHQWSSQLNTLSGGINDFWNDGSLLCTLINSAIPGACPNPYGHWKKPPIHAQDVAYKYLGIRPVFTEKDFVSSYSSNIESKFLNYLFMVHRTIYGLEKEKLMYNLISAKFVARGMGLYTAEQFKQAEFYIYSKYDTVSFYNIEIVIVGPYSTYCRTTVLEHLVKEGKTKSLHKICELSPRSINLEIDIEKDRLRVAYVMKHCGVHEINLSCSKEIITGSPFYVNATNYSLLSPKSDNEAPVLKLNNNFVADKKFKAASNEKNNNNTTFEPEIYGESKKLLTTTTHVLEISKFLKDLNNSQEKKTNTHNNNSMSQEKLMCSCSAFFLKEDYSYFQKLADSSFRTACNITRASPVIRQHKFRSSPVCGEHIVPEGCKKVYLDKQLMTLPAETSPAPLSKSRTLSSFSDLENKEDEIVTNNNHKPVIVGEVLLKDNNLKLTNRLQHDLNKRTLQKMVLEKKLFWERIFAESKAAKNRAAHNITRRISNGKLKHVDSLYLLRKRPVSKSLSDLRKIEDGISMKPYRSADDNLDKCCRIRLEERLKCYLENIGVFNGDIWISYKKTFSASSQEIKQKLFKPSTPLPKKSFKKAVAFFRNLEISSIKMNTNKVAPMDNDRSQNQCRPRV